LFSKRDLFKLILPMIISQVLSITIGTVNSIMVSSAGEAAVSGVSLVNTLDALLVIAFSSLVTGGAVTLSHALGKGDKAFTLDCAKQLLYVATGISLVLTVAVGIFREPLLRTLYGNAEASVLHHANAYLRIMLLSFPMLAIENAGYAIFRIMGKTTINMYLSFAANLMNVAGNFFFIRVMHMEAAGAATSTLLVRAVIAIVITVLLHNRKLTIYYDNLLHYRPNMPIIKEILRIGVPHGVESSMFQFGRLVTQILISTTGTAAIAANSVANTLANYQYLPATSIENATITVIGRCYGAGELEQAKKNSRTLLFWTYLCMWLVSLVLFLFAKPIIGIYKLSEAGTSIALQLTYFHCICTSLIRPLAFNFPSVFKAAGDAKYTMVVSSLSMWIVRIGFAYILTLESINILGLTIPGLGMGIMGVWVAMIADWTVRAILYTIRYLRGTWLRQGNRNAKSAQKTT